ncbi:MAG: prepilin-type N-terminal cleavage/methylation domain-containing protein [Armatimonadota bacterium]|nr:prepilin-type N-terminal cleavage/methylation domain-containing protein [Armatimonadota bacterium]MDR7532760.1 prepilin-type N-terminal cleavage/methylation domain-containing protein [Armatimonadota bacterium]MDR7537092.1 prepilin-type N-terminal cleavage/methylation domain-containing protein [Armatimonadota bacterium]
MTGVGEIMGSRWHGQAGLTLLEVLVAAAVFAVVAAAATRTMGLLLRVAADQGRRAVAAALATQKLEEVRARPEAQVTAAARKQGFDCLRAEGPQALAGPYTGYAYTVTIAGVQVDPAATAPSWLHPAAAAPCRPPPGAHGDLLQWISVRVTFRGRVLAQVTSATLREVR